MPISSNDDDAVYNGHTRIIPTWPGLGCVLIILPFRWAEAFEIGIYILYRLLLLLLLHLRVCVLICVQGQSPEARSNDFRFRYGTDLKRLSIPTILIHLPKKRAGLNNGRPPSLRDSKASRQTRGRLAVRHSSIVKWLCNMGHYSRVDGAQMVLVSFEEQ